MSKPSKFSAIIDQARGRGSEPEETLPPDAPTPPPAVPPELPAVPPSPITSTPGPSPALPQSPPSRGPGRPKGKRSDPAFEQVTAYLPSALYTRVRIALMEDGRRQDFSGLVAELVATWLDHRGRE